MRSLTLSSVLTGVEGSSSHPVGTCASLSNVSYGPRVPAWGRPAWPGWLPSGRHFLLEKLCGRSHNWGEMWRNPLCGHPSLPPGCLAKGHAQGTILRHIIAHACVEPSPSCSPSPMRLHDLPETASACRSRRAPGPHRTARTGRWWWSASNRCSYHD